MNAIGGLRSILAALFLLMVTAYTASGAGGQQRSPGDPQACTAQEPEGLTDQSMRWRLRAYHNLDCLMGKLERAMQRPAGTRRDEVTLSREEAEQLLNLAWWAKDAAQRIGH